MQKIRPKRGRIGNAQPDGLRKIHVGRVLALRKRVKRPAEPMIPFGLACYACQMGRLEEGRFWLRKAFSTAKSSGREKRLRSMALDQPELEPLLRKIPIQRFESNANSSLD